MGTAPPEPWILGGNKVLPPQGLRFWGGTTFSKSRSPPNFFVPPQDFGGEHPHFGGERLQNAQNPFPPKRLGGKFSAKSAVPPQDGGGTAPPSLWDLGGNTAPPRPLRSGGAIPVSPPNLGGGKASMVRVFTHHRKVGGCQFESATMAMYRSVGHSPTH